MGLFRSVPTQMAVPEYPRTDLGLLHLFQEMPAVHLPTMLDRLPPASSSCPLEILFAIFVIYSPGLCMHFLKQDHNFLDHDCIVECLYNDLTEKVCHSFTLYHKIELRNCHLCYCVLSYRVLQWYVFIACILSNCFQT